MAESGKRRHTPIPPPARPSRCQMCGSPIDPRDKTGRPKRFCGASCRNQAQRQRDKHARAVSSTG